MGPLSCTVLGEAMSDDLQALGHSIKTPLVKAAMRALGVKARLLPATKRLVTALDKLNRQHRGGLIETMEREELCAFIDATLRATGVDPGGDVTAPWREW